MLMLVLETLVLGVFLFISIIWKLITPEKMRDKYANPFVEGVASLWVRLVLVWMKTVLRTEFDIQSQVKLSKQQWYLLVSNHQSWVDIFAIFQTTLGHTPLLKYFIKKELGRLPIVGQAWWALDYPFMQRHSREYLRKHPEKADDDLRATQKACEKFQYKPTAIVNFLEGTRFSEEKHSKQKSPFQHLLKPKAGGIAFAVQALGERFRAMLDFTIVYEGAPPSFWDMACGRVGKVTIMLRQLEIPEPFLTMDYTGNAQDKVSFQNWLQEIWQEKDQLIGTVKAR